MAGKSTKSDIVDHLTSAVEGLTKAKAGEAVDEIAAFITGALAAWDQERTHPPSPWARPEASTAGSSWPTTPSTGCGCP